MQNETIQKYLNSAIHRGQLEERHEENASQAGARSATGYRRRNFDPALNACPQTRPRCANQRFELDRETGEIASIRETGKTKLQFNGMELDARVGAGTIRVNQVLKGNAPAEGVSFQIYTSDKYIGWASPRTNSYAIYFLKADSSGNTQFTSPYYPDVPTIPTSVVSEGAPIDKVIVAIKEVLSSPETTLNQKTRAVYFLSHSKGASATARLYEALNDSTQEVQISAAAALLQRNDTTGLGTAKETLLHGSQITSMELRQNLIYAIAQGVQDPKALPTLSELLVSPDAEVRRAVASSLMHIRSPEAINLMISLLDDSDFEARYYAVVGLAETTNQLDWRPNMDDFRGDESRYLKHWLDWTTPPKTQQ